MYVDFPKKMRKSAQIEDCWTESQSYGRNRTMITVPTHCILFNTLRAYFYDATLSVYLMPKSVWDSVSGSNYLSGNADLSYKYLYLYGVYINLQLYLSLLTFYFF